MSDYGFEYRRVRQAERVLSQTLGGEAVLLDLKSEKYFGLDTTGTRIWELIGESGEVQRIFNTLIAEFDAPPDAIARDLSALPQPSLRPRADLDLLVSPDQVNAWHQLLTRSGFVQSSANEGTLITRERSYGREVTPESSFSLDLHWALNNSPLLTLSAPSFDRLWDRSVSLAALGTDARGLGPVDAVLMACIHRAGHRHAPYYSDGVAYLGGNRLIWLHDIHLLAQQMNASDWGNLLNQARAMQVCAVCADALNVTAQRFSTPLTASAMKEMRAAGAGELSAAFIRGSPLAVKLAEFRALPALRLKLRWLREHLFPGAEYTLEKYGHRNPALLPWLYLRRIGNGALKLLAKSRSGRSP